MKISLTKEQKVNLEAQHKSERDGRIRDRIKAVLLANEGWDNKQIAQALRTHYTTVFGHLCDYLREEKLKPNNGGSTSKLDENQTQKLIAHLEENTYPSTKELFRETTRLISPVKNLDGTANIPPHNTGAAVDVEIIDGSGNLIDMGMAIADWVHVHPDLCLSRCDLLSKEVQKNRHILLEVMQSYDFVNYPMEWWHFSYGDRYWAYHKKVACAMYDALV